MTTLFEPTAGVITASESVYRFHLDTVAPGIVQIVDSMQAVDEQWYETLERIVPFINATDEQRQLLMASADDARKGLPPPAGAATKFDIAKLVTWASAGALILKLF